MRDDDGAGSVLAVAIVGGLVALTMLLLPLQMGFAIRQSVAAAADAAALAAADTAVGRAPGYPCDAAARLAVANGAALDSCTVDGLVITVRVSRHLFGIAMTATATAGPPAAGVD